MNNILIINGPNLNLLGKREPVLYGAEDFQGFFATLQAAFPTSNLEYVQTNDEADMVGAIHRGGMEGMGIVLNPAAYTHTSLAVADAVRAVDVPVVEVHLTNIYGREPFRHRSFVGPAASGVIMGFGLEGYRLAVAHLLES